MRCPAPPALTQSMGMGMASQNGTSMMGQNRTTYTLRTGAGPLGPNDNCTTNTGEPFYQDLATIEISPDTLVIFQIPLKHAVLQVSMLDH